MSKLPDFGALPEADDAPLRLCQNPQTGMLYLNRLATKKEMADLTAQLVAKELHEACEAEAAALQERAERAEALLRRIWKEGLYEDQTSELIEAFFRPT